MIDWSTIKETIRDQVVRLTGLSPSVVRWVDEPSGDLFGKEPVIYMRISSVRSVGIEENRREDNGLNDQTVTVSGQREFTLSVRCESFTQDIADQKFAGNVLENLKTRMRRTSSRDERAGIFGIAAMLPSQFFSYTDAEREINAYIADLICTTVDNDADTTIGAGDWVGEVAGTGTVKDSGGNTIAADPFDITKP